MSNDRYDLDIESTRMTCTSGRIVRTPGCDMPYKVVLTRIDGGNTEHAFVTIHECETFIRRNTPPPAARCTLFDHEAGEA